MENFICNQYGVKLAILNSENIEICGWISKEAIKMHMSRIYAKMAFFISQGSVATCVRWGWYCRTSFVAHFIRFPTVRKLWKSVNIWQSYREFNGGNFFLRHSVYTVQWVRGVSSWLMAHQHEKAISDSILWYWVTTTVMKKNTCTHLKW